MNKYRNINESLQAKKEELLKELKYYEKRIENARSKTSSSSFYDESSDSEQEFTVELEPSISELKLKQSMLQTCLFATQELTNMQILQSEVNILVNEPVFEREQPIKEVGVWKEVTVECRVDLVPFSMNFFVHQPKRLFAPYQYRSLQVNPVKDAHERELSTSILSAVNTPSDAVEVLRSYARAHRSRRTTLARLAEKYCDLFMEPMSEGGYILKCANLLEISWMLQNKWSPIAPFHHRMKFDLEYMDESYIKIITQAHRQLSDPAVETDERTLLLAKIINTCLEAQKQTNKPESESDTDNNLGTITDKKDKDSVIMAPPKAIPKKNKKRHSDEDVASKRSKIDDKENTNNDTDKNNAKTNSSKINKQSNKDNKEIIKNISKTDNETVFNSKNIYDTNTTQNGSSKANKQNEKGKKHIHEDKTIDNKDIGNNKKRKGSANSVVNDIKSNKELEIKKNNKPNVIEQTADGQSKKDRNDNNTNKQKHNTNIIPETNKDTTNKEIVRNKQTTDKNTVKHIKTNENIGSKQKISNKKTNIPQTESKTDDKITDNKGKDVKTNNKNIDSKKNKIKSKTETEKPTTINSDVEIKNSAANKETDKNKTSIKNKDNTTSNNRMKLNSNLHNNLEKNNIKTKAIDNKTKLDRNKLKINKTVLNKSIKSVTSIVSELQGNATNKRTDVVKSRIPQRISSSAIKKNVLRLSPRFIKKPSMKPKT